MRGSRRTGPVDPEPARRSPAPKSAEPEQAAHDAGPVAARSTASARSITRVQQTAGNRAARALAGAASERAYSPPAIRVDATPPGGAARETERAPEPAPAARTVTPGAELSAAPVTDLATRWSDAQRELGITTTAPTQSTQRASVQRTPVQRAGPTLRPGTKGDTVTVAGDVATIGAGVTTGVKTIGDGISVPGIGEITPAVDVIEFSSAAAEILAFVSLGLNIFSLGENLVRGWDAKIRLAAFTKAYEQLPADDPLRPYLRDAAKQQQWEKNRRWIRVAVTAAVIGLTIAALTVASGGALLLAIATVLAIGKGFETMRNLWRKYKAKKQQKAAATEMFDQAYAAAPDSPTRTTFVELLRTLNIPVPDETANSFQKQRSFAIDQLAPHLSRTDDAIKQTLPQQAAAFVAQADAQADAQIAEVEGAAEAAGVDPEAQAQAAGGGGAEAAEAEPQPVAAAQGGS